jgi:undecaprenyl-diphosphatase
MLETILNFDTDLFLFLNGLNSPFWDPLMIFFSGKLIWLPLFLLIYFMYRVFGWRLVWPLIGVALVVALADQTSVHLFKNVFERLRPCHNPEIKELVHLAAGRCGGRFGFVSSHAANSFGVAVFLSLLFKRRWFSISILVWAALVSYSRIYLGVHYPADIFFGGLLGATCGYAVWNLLVGIDRVKSILRKK